MARLEDLITSVKDASLREALREEVKALKNRTRFGLVYERHLPETLCLAAEGNLRVGDQVRLRREPDDETIFRVERVRGKKVTIVDGDGRSTEAGVTDLMVVKPFGEPIYPTLKSVGKIERSKEKPYHTVINGENYHALQLLRHTCEGQVDCIYIDPPYNSGARDWKYNNHYVDTTDSWRHSKWLSFMEKRLRLARDLLKEDGVLIVTADENEIHHLALILEDLFKAHLRYMITIVINPKGTPETNFGRVEEYAIFVVPDLEGGVIPQLPPAEDAPEDAVVAEADDDSEGDEGIWIRELTPSGDLRLPAAIREVAGDSDAFELTVRDEVVEMRALEAGGEEPGKRTEDDERDAFSVLHLRRRGAESSFRKDRWRQFYAIDVNTKTKQVVGIGPELALDAPYESNHRRGDVLSLYPIDEDGNERVWRYGRETMQRLIDAGEIRVGMHAPKKPQPYTLNHWKPREGPRVQRVRTVWWRTSHDAGTHGTTLLSRLLGASKPFSFPKSVYAVRDCLEAVVRNRRDALIVDFFAGSGTTLHSTCLLNAADGGSRRTILVTNNEVEEKVAKRLHAEGNFIGDPEFEAQGIFEAVTRPRCESVISGKRPDGKPIPSGKRFQHLDGRPFAEGFEENCEFFRLEYLDPDKVELGRSLDALHPLYWLRAGARAARPRRLQPKSQFAVFEDAGYAVLFDETATRELAEELKGSEGIRHVFLRTDSDDAYAEMCGVLGPGFETERLHADYLDEFRREVKVTP